MEVQQRAQLEREVERTILSFFRYLDTRQYEKLVSLIAPTACGTGRARR
jgi:hypothetical protein